jgi:GDP/UDP-N,N'-diacetylbacillosamine 2-epimerase (hydrolysing)
MPVKTKKSKKKIAIITGIRSEYSLLYPLIKKIQENPSLELKLFVTGAHLSESFGRTVSEIEADGFLIEERIESLLSSNTGAGRIKGAAIQLLALVQAFQRVKPDIVVAPFDREEAMTVALAGSYMNIPIAHVGAGDKVIGNVDDYIRHAVTKLAHIHFAATENNQKRIIKMGEEPWRVYNVGSLGIDKYRMIEDIPVQSLSEELKFDITRKPLLVVIHNPLSTESEQAGVETHIIMRVLDKLKFQTVVIYPNSDAGCHDIIKAIRRYESIRYIKTFENLPKDIFVNLMRHCDVLIGNSSCGILEAPFLKVPVVNIGKRQMGREHAENVIFVDYDEEQIEAAVKKAIYDKRFKERVRNCENPYGDGNASERIVKILSNIKLDKRFLQKEITY